MKTLEIVSYDYGKRLADVMPQSNMNSGRLETNCTGKGLVIPYLPNIEEFTEMTGKYSDCEFIILPGFSPYSHFGASIWNGQIPVLTVPAPDFSFTGNETVLIDFDLDTMYVAESPNDKQDLRRQFLADENKSTPAFSNQNHGHPFDILGEATTPEEIELSLSMGAAGMGVLKAELFYSNNQLNLIKIKQITEYLKASKKHLPLLIRFFDYEVQPTGICVLSQPTKYLGYPGVRLLEVEPFWLEKFLQLLEAFETNDITPILPMVKSASEVRRFKETISNKYKNVAVTMERPAAALAIDEIAELSSFVEIGLNDLTQHSMAWDRDVPNANRMPANQIHASVARLIENVVQSYPERSVNYALGLDLKPSISLATQLN